MLKLRYHEGLYGQPRTLRRLRDARILICGAGTLGASLAESLASAGCARLTVIDPYRVEERNPSAILQELTVASSPELLLGTKLVIDALDHSAARAALSVTSRNASIPCLHAGLYRDYAEAVWNEHYRVSGAVEGESCVYPPTCELVALAAAITVDAAIRYLVAGKRESYTLTLTDFAILPYEP